MEEMRLGRAGDARDEDRIMEETTPVKECKRRNRQRTMAEMERVQTNVSLGTAYLESEFRQVGNVYVDVDGNYGKGKWREGCSIKEEV